MNCLFKAPLHPAFGRPYGVLTMNRRCLICESDAILTKDAAVGIVLLVGIAGGWLRDVHQARQEARSHTF